MREYLIVGVVTLLSVVAIVLMVAGRDFWIETKLRLV